MDTGRDETRSQIRRELERRGVRLSFVEPLERCFETETEAARVKHLVGAGILALILPNMFLIPDSRLMPDAFGRAVVLHVVSSLIYSAVLFYTASHPTAHRREAAHAVSMTLSVLGTIALLHSSASPLRSYVCTTYVLFIVFVNVGLRLRFAWSVAFNAVAGVSTCLSAFLVGGEPAGVREVTAFSLFTAAAFTLYANYVLEAGERRGFLLTLDQRLCAEQIAQINDRLDTLSATDWLTGAANRRGLERQLAKIWAQSAARGQPLAILMIDVDHFKLFNDCHGHPAGDACLASLATLIGQQLREGQDFLGRYGGEEFAVILPGASPAEAVWAAERIRQNVEDMALPHGAPGAGPWVTVSIGAESGAPGGTGTPEQLISAADRALYQSKQAGRNRVHPALAPGAWSPVLGRDDLVRQFWPEEGQGALPPGPPPKASLRNPLHL